MHVFSMLRLRTIISLVCLTLMYSYHDGITGIAGRYIKAYAVCHCFFVKKNRVVDMKQHAIISSCATNTQLNGRRATDPEHTATGHLTKTTTVLSISACVYNIVAFNIN